AFPKRQAAERAHEGQRLGGRHGWVETALLGKVADLMGDLERTVMAKQAAMAGAWIDDAEHHPKAGGLARAVGAENAGNAAFGNGEGDPVDRPLAVEILDEVAGLGGDLSFPHGANG